MACCERCGAAPADGPLPSTPVQFTVGGVIYPAYNLAHNLVHKPGALFFLLLAPLRTACQHPTLQKLSACMLHFS
jgi:hypothetical protein